MTVHREYARDEVYPSYWVNLIQEVLSGAVTDFELRIKSGDATKVELAPAGPGGIAALVIEGKWRFVSSTIERTHPGGSSGTYSIWAVAADDDVVSTPLPNTDNTVYPFELRITTGSAPGTHAREEQIGTCVWNSAAGVITSVQKSFGRVYESSIAGTLADRLASPGDIKPGAWAAAPTGWLLCDGSAVSRSTYRRLFDAIGTAYGVGDGSTTFNVPDLRGRSPVGVDGGAGRITANNTRGAAGGAESVTLTTSHLPAHTHGAGTLAIGSHTHGVGTLAIGNHTHGAGTLAAASAGDHTHSLTGISIGSGGGHGHAHTLAVAVGGGHGHGFSLSTNTAGSHSHTISAQREANTPTTGSVNRVQAFPPESNANYVRSTDAAGSHAHTVSGSVGGSDGTHSHTLSGSIGGTDGTHSHEVTGGSVGSAGAHTHSLSGETGTASGSLSGETAAASGSLSGSTGSAGSGTAHENLGPYQVVNFAIKT